MQMSETNNNQHIEKYLNWYLNPLKNKSPDFAVLITGDWGSGKTTFIKKFLKYKTPIVDNLTGLKTLVIYVSLFGVRNRTEIDERINEELKLFFNDSIKLAGKAILNLSEIVAMVTAGEEGIKVVNESSRIAKDTLKFLNKGKLKSTAVVFDDVERADMRLPELLGYINEYVEHKCLPCILIADEKVWDKANETEENQDNIRSLHKFSSVKEKIIGRTLKVQTTINEILEKWLKPQAENESPFGDDLRKFLDPYRKTILAVFETLECQNFRILKQSLDSWSYFQNLLKKDFLKNHSFSEELLKTFLALEVWYRLGKLEANDLLKHDDWISDIDFIKLLKAQNTENNKENFDSILQLVKKFSSNLNTIIPSQEWQHWLVCGTLNQEKICIHIKNSFWFREIKNAWLTDFASWHTLTDKHFKEVLSEVFQKLKKKNITNPSTLLLVYDRFLFMEKEGKKFTKKEFSDFNTDIFTTFSNYLNTLLKKNLLETTQVGQLTSMGYWCHDDEKFKSFSEKLLQRDKEIAVKNRAKEANDLIELMKSDTYKAAELINNGTLDHQLPILSFANPKAFVDTYIQIEGTKKELIFQSLEKRYITPESLKFLLSEKEFLENVLEESKRHRNEDEFASSTYALKFLIGVCEKAIEKLNKV
jgi:GTPase SAR1 family protein